MNKEQAITILVEVAHLAQKTGVLSLQDAASVLNAINTVSQPEEPKTEETKEEPKK